MSATTDELHALGYFLEYSSYGVVVHRYNGADGETLLDKHAIHAGRCVTDKEACAMGWDWARAGLVKRRLDGDLS